MRTFRLDFTQDNPLLDGCYIGRIGEHNATELIITPPAEMTANGDITQYIVAFSTGGKVIHSALIAKSETVELPLWSQLTQNRNLLFQLEGYDDNIELVVKSPVVALKLLPSVDGKDVEADTNCPDLKAQVVKNTATLDKFSEDENGNLLYNGEAIGGGGTGLTYEQAADLAENTEARHTHQNSDVLDSLGINNANTRPTFNGNTLATQNDVTTRVAEHRTEVYTLLKSYAKTEDISTEIETALAEAKASGEFDGQDGKNGVDGTDGVSVSSIEQTTTSTADGGTNVITVTLSNGDTFTFNVKNGSKGSTGTAGTNGKDGSDGADGYTPVKGTDYFTEADKAEIVDDVVTETGIEIIPDYVITEAESVIDRIIAAQGNRTFTFAAISDLHYGNGNYTDGVKHACQAMKYIDERIKLDAVAVLGDYTDGYPAEGFENAIGDFKTINSVLADLRFAPNLRTQGNHDYYADHTALVNRFIQSYSDNVVWGSKSGGYFYRDFEEFKLRIICVNTTEEDNANIDCSDAQYEWFVQSLDMSAKDDAAEWQILILSHHPLDWYSNDSTSENNYWYQLPKIVYGYKNGFNSATASGYGSSFKPSFDFSQGNNSAKIIANIHGHIHNLLVAPIYLNIGATSAGDIGVYRMATPEACIGRENQYSDIWQEETSYPKTSDTAQDTAFVIYCIDLDTYTINAICYGAGYDRAVEYSTGEIITTYKVTNNLTNVSNSNSAATAKTGEGYTATLTATAGEITSVVVTMDGADITNTAYSDGVISIASVTGNIVITAVAEVPEVSYTNMLTRAVASDGSAYNGGQGWKTDYRLGSAGTESAQNGMEVTGFIPVTKADTIYFSGISWAYDSASSSYFYLHFYDSSFAKLTGQKMSERLGTADEYVTYNGTNPAAITVQTFCNYTGYTGDAIAYFRISAEEITTDSVITVNEPIE